MKRKVLLVLAFVLVAVVSLRIGEHLQLRADMRVIDEIMPGILAQCFTGTTNT